MAALDYMPRVLLVTGGCGFIGSNFINCFHAEFPQVSIVNVDRLDYCARRENVEGTTNASWYTFYPVDITDARVISNILRHHKPDAIIHFAAQSHVDNSFGNSLTFTHDNVVGTHTLLECCRTELMPCGTLKRFIHISTDEVYGEVSREHPGCSEASLLNPTNPYAASKAAAEFQVRAYNHSYGLPVIITRGNNVYGPHQYPEKVIPRFIKQILGREAITIQGTGEATRNFIHVFDVAAAVKTILQRGEIGGIYNVGGDCELSVMEVARRLLGLMCPEKAGEANQITYIADRLFNDQRYAVKNDALVALGWTPKITFDEGLQQTVGWYCANISMYQA